MHTAGEILAAQRNSTRVLTKADIAAFIESHLGLTAKEKAHQDALAAIEKLTIALGKAQKQARQAEGKLLAATKRIAALEAEWSPAVD